MANFDSKDVSIVDTGNLAEVMRVAVAEAPVQVLAHPDGDRAIVVEAKNRVQIISHDGSILKTIAVSSDPAATDRPAALTPDGTTLYVVSGAELFSVDLQSGTVTSVDNPLMPFAVGISPDGQFLGLAGLDALNFLSFEVIAVVMDRVTGDLYAYEEIGGLLDITQPTVCAFQPGEFSMAVGSMSGNAVTFVDFGDPFGTQDIVVGSGPFDMLFLDEHRLAVGRLGTSQVTMLDAVTRTTTGVLDVGVEYPHGMAYDPERDLLYVPGTQGNLVSVVKVSTGEVQDTIGVGQGPNSVALLTGPSSAKTKTRNEIAAAPKPNLMTESRKAQQAWVTVLEPDISQVIHDANVSIIAEVPASTTAVVAGREYGVDAHSRLAFTWEVLDGENQIPIQLLDESGGLIDSDIVTFVGDPPPRIRIAAPAEGEVFDALATTVVVEIDSLDIVSLSINGDPQTVADTVQYSLTLPQGQSQVVVVAKDASGQSTRLERFMFTSSEFDWSPRGRKLDAFDEELIEIPWPSPAGVLFFGETYQSLYASPNGVVTFGAPPEGTTDSDSIVAGPPGISIFGTDLNPAYSLRFGTGDGGLYVSQGPGQLLLTWDRVPLYDERRFMTAQLTLWEDGTVQIAYARVDNNEVMISLTSGNETLDAMAALDLSSLAEPVDTPGAFYESFSSGNPFDLEGLSLLMTPQGQDGYTVQRGARPFTRIPGWARYLRQ